VLLGLVASVAGIVTVGVGLANGRPDLQRQARFHVLLVLAGAVIAAVAMEVALLRNDFSLTYVAEHSARATPLLYKVATMWAALEGSIILWALILAGYIAVTTWWFRRRLDDAMVSWAIIVMLSVAAFFFFLLLTAADPFGEVSGVVPSDGPGPNPLLQNHPLMAIHPPCLYLGYVGFTVPFAFATAALVTGRLGEGWLIETRRWTLFAWGFLSVGIVLGSWWSYEVLGWGGYWAWDPVENASFLPWLTGTAFLHSVIVQERRGMLRVWNLSLVMATFALTILGTFLTRSGVIASVHAFTEGSIGPLLLGFLGVVLAVSLGLIAWRGDLLRSPGAIDSPVSREGAFLLNNLLFAGFAFVVLLGTVFPLLVEAIRGDRIAVGTPYFERMAMPIGLALLFLMAVAPLLPWRRTSAELLRQRALVPAWCGGAVLVLAVVLGARGLAPLVAFALAGFAGGAALRQITLGVRRGGWRGVVGRTNGGMVVHLGVVVLAMGLAASGSFSHEGEFTLAEGESGQVAGHQVTYIGSTTVDTGARIDEKARVVVDGRVFEPGVQKFPTGQTVLVPSVRTGLREDVYLVLVRAPEAAGDPILLRVIVEPMVAWLWTGGLLMGFGTLLAAIPDGRRRVPAPVVAESLEEKEPAGVG
jgi:cytochrome c-type biogenesis protein CcmF